MTAHLLVPGAGGQGWYWHLVADELNRRGHQAIALDLPGADPDAGLPEYRDAIVSAADWVGEPVTLVAQSLGAFSAPLACEGAAVERIVLVNPMIPRSGETAGEWWDAVGWQDEAEEAARRDGRAPVDLTDLDTLFFHDLPEDLVQVMRDEPDAAAESPAIFAQSWPLATWPDVPTVVLVGSEDRLFPPPLQRRVARERLGLSVEELPGGHLVALSQPVRLAERIVGSDGA